ncbi:alpha/beta hydrolase [Chitinivorax sp. PXF-14]|uniref:alpha/beta fold hydrolase n=1 Tax=Chitinivorax sp. PXF-14 TaxID=3230488 RepID=UPI003466FF46
MENTIMHTVEAPTPVTTDSWLDSPRGRVFVRRWHPPGKDATTPGPRSPIVLFHDSLGCVELWRDFPAMLCSATGREVIAYDRLGFGRSDALSSPPALDFIADEARRVFPLIRQQLGLQRFVVLGHSVGGGMAVNCAAAFAADCDALITIAAQTFPEDKTLHGIRVAKAQLEDKKQIERLQKYHGDKAGWVLDAWTETWLHPEFASWSLDATLPQVSCPTLAIHGLHDEYGSLIHPETIGRLGRGKSRVEIVQDAAHMPHREQPEAIAGLIAEFLREH